MPQRGRRRSTSPWATFPASFAMCPSTPAKTACWSAARRATSCGSAWPANSLVFSPGEKLRLEVQPHLLPVPADTKIRLKAQLVSARPSSGSCGPRRARGAGGPGGGHPAGNPLARPRGRLRPQPHGGLRLELAALGPLLVELEAGDRRAESAVAGGRSAAGRRRPARPASSPRSRKSTPSAPPGGKAKASCRNSPG